MHERLRQYTPQLQRNEFADRQFWFVVPEFRQDCIRIKEAGSASTDLLLTPAEQLRSIMRSFVIGRPLTNGREFKKIRPHPQHVLELRSSDVRVFGWLANRDCFVACFADLIENLKATPNKAGDAYKKYISSVVQIRGSLGLPCVESEDLNDQFTNVL